MDCINNVYSSSISLPNIYIYIPSDVVSAYKSLLKEKDTLQKSLAAAVAAAPRATAPSSLHHGGENGEDGMPASVHADQAGGLAAQVSPAAGGDMTDAKDVEELRSRVSELTTVRKPPWSILFPSTAPRKLVKCQAACAYLHDLNTMDSLLSHQSPTLPRPSFANILAPPPPDYQQHYGRAGSSFGALCCR